LTLVFGVLNLIVAVARDPAGTGHGVMLIKPRGGQRNWKVCFVEKSRSSAGYERTLKLEGLGYSDFYIIWPPKKHRTNLFQKKLQTQMGVFHETCSQTANIHAFRTINSQQHLLTDAWNETTFDQFFLDQVVDTFADARDRHSDLDSTKGSKSLPWWLSWRPRVSNLPYWVVAGFPL